MISKINSLKDNREKVSEVVDEYIEKTTDSELFDYENSNSYTAWFYAVSAWGKLVKW